MGIPEEPPSVAALKTAYQALRRASGVFEELGRQIAAYPDAPSEDVLPLEATPLGAWILTEWARAEAEGMLRMFSEAEGKASHKLIARIAYAEAERYAAIHERITGAYDKDIASYLTMRAALAAASGLYRQAMIQSEAGEHGIACAYINAAMTELETVRSVVGDSSTGSSSSSSSSSSFFSSLSRAVFGDSSLQSTVLSSLSSLPLPPPSPPQQRSSTAKTRPFITRSSRTSTLASGSLLPTSPNPSPLQSLLLPFPPSNSKTTLPPPC